jgi:hypothetical protein
VGRRRKKKRPAYADRRRGCGVNVSAAATNGKTSKGQGKTQARDRLTNDRQTDMSASVTVRSQHWGTQFSLLERRSPMETFRHNVGFTAAV